ncbi:hypothetical protein [Mycobacterium sp. MMS18-G62]
MAVGVVWYPPIDQQTYDAVREKVLQASIDKGQQFHAAGQADGRWCIIEVWGSRDSLQRFLREDLGPAFEAIGLGEGDPPVPELVFDVHFHRF